MNSITGWYEMMFRGYEPTIGRMLQIDPAAAKFGGLTPYNYGFNNPIRWNDPSGADPTLEEWVKGVNEMWAAFDRGGLDAMTKVQMGQLAASSLWDAGSGERKAAVGELLASALGGTRSNYHNSYKVIEGRLVLVSSANHGGGSRKFALTMACTNCDQMDVLGFADTDSEELAKYGKVIGGVSAMAGGGVLQKGIVIEYGTVHTDKNWYQDYKTVYKVTTSASISITANAFVVINKDGFTTTFSDWAGPINEAVISYGWWSVSAGWSTTYETFGGGVGPGASLPAGTAAYMTGTTTLIGEPRYYAPPTYPADRPYPPR